MKVTFTINNETKRAFEATAEEVMGGFVEEGIIDEMPEKDIIENETHKAFSINRTDDGVNTELTVDIEDEFAIDMVNFAARTVYKFLPVFKFVKSFAGGIKSELKKLGDKWADEYEYAAVTLSSNTYFNHNTAILRRADSNNKWELVQCNHSDPVYPEMYEIPDEDIKKVIARTVRKDTQKAIKTLKFTLHGIYNTIEEAEAFFENEKEVTENA